MKHLLEVVMSRGIMYFFQHTEELDSLALLACHQGCSVVLTFQMPEVRKEEQIETYQQHQGSVRLLRALRSQDNSI